MLLPRILGPREVALPDTWDPPKHDRFRRDAVNVTFEEKAASTSLWKQAFPALLGGMAGTVLAVAALYALGWLST